MSDVDGNSDTWSRVVDIPVEELPSGRVAQEWGYERRLCCRCAAAWFGLPGPEDADRVGLHGGDMCASCGAEPRDAHQMATGDLEELLVRAPAAGA